MSDSSPSRYDEHPIETVLIVDDQRDITSLFDAWLRDTYTTSVANSGHEALERVSQATDVVLLDRRMPAIDGDQVLDSLRARGFEGQVVLVTAVEPDFDIIDLGFDDYLLKPVSRDELLGVLDSLAVRRQYESSVGELFTLVSKRAHLRTQKSTATLAENDAYQDLEARIRELEHETKELVFAMKGTDAAIALRRVAISSGGGERE